MNPPFEMVAPDRLQIREGGGCMSVFGLPFFAAGIFMFLTIVGVVPMTNGDEQTSLTWALVGLLSVVFTAVGGALVFGRSWTIVDRTRREVVRQWGLLVPLRERVEPFHGYTAVRLGFVEGDSDSADRFPIAFTSTAGPDLQLASFTSYAQARECARALAEHVHLDVDDASTDHPIRLSSTLFDIPLQKRLRVDGGASVETIERPTGARSQVTRADGRVTIVIPPRPMHPAALVASLLPLAIPLYFGPPLAAFFRESNTPDPVGWAFLAFLTVCFGILPMTIGVGAFLRSRRGATIVEISRQGVNIRERGVWRTNTIASIDAADILDVDYSSRDSAIESATRAAEQQVLQTHPDSSPAIGGRVERLLTRLARHVTGKGLTVKSRTGLTTIGKGLDDDEVRYLHAIVRRALTE